MRKENLETEVVYYSGENDWTDKDGNTIVVWGGTLLPEDQYVEFEDWMKEEFEVDAKAIGSFTNLDGITTFVFTVKESLGGFAIKRLQYGMRWFYDMFSETNGGVNLPFTEEKNLQTIINSLGLEIA